MQNIDTTPYQEFAREKLGFEFDDIELLVTAFTHRSYMNEHKKSAKVHNELDTWRRLVKENNIKSE